MKNKDKLIESIDYTKLKGKVDHDLIDAIDRINKYGSIHPEKIEILDVEHRERKK